MEGLIIIFIITKECKGEQWSALKWLTNAFQPKEKKEKKGILFTVLPPAGKMEKPLKGWQSTREKLAGDSTGQKRNVTELWNTQCEKVVPIFRWAGMIKCKSSTFPWTMYSSFHPERSAVPLQRDGSDHVYIRDGGKEVKNQTQCPISLFTNFKALD